MSRELLQRAIAALEISGIRGYAAEQTYIDIRAELEKQEEQDEPCKRCSSYKVLVKSLESQIRRHRQLESDYMSAIATLESERKANEILTNELEKRQERDADLVITYAKGYESGIKTYVFGVDDRTKVLLDALESIADVSMGRHKSTYDMLIWHGEIARAAIAKYGEQINEP
jgi:hypothetical protein